MPRGPCDFFCSSRSAAVCDPNSPHPFARVLEVWETLGPEDAAIETRCDFKIAPPRMLRFVSAIFRQFLWCNLQQNWRFALCDLKSSDFCDCIFWGALSWETARLLEMGQIRWFQTPNSVSFLALSEFWRESSVSSFGPMICVPERTHRVAFSRDSLSLAQLIEFFP